MIIARKTQGKHRQIKNRINVILFVIFLLLPFLRFGGKPMILLDIPARKFYIFSLTIWPQEMYFLHLLLFILGLMLFFFTALLGRLWCGFACPQTLFTEVYDFVGRLVGGEKFGKRSATTAVWARVYFAWAVLSLLFSLLFLTYFMPYEEIFDKIIRGDFYESEGSTIISFWVWFIIGSAGIFFANMAWFRENMCNLVCPYGRFQTALLDSHSPIVSYNLKRGEPRKIVRGASDSHKSSGDCIDCDMCVLVCPTGIDIRDGLQVGCLACGLCVDACTNVMKKVDKETLIDYRTIEQTENPSAHRKYLRPRTVLYGVMLTGLLSVFVYFLVNRSPVYAYILRDRAIQNVFIPGIGHQNGYELRIGNKTDAPMKLKLQISGGGKFELIGSNEFYTVAPGELEKIRFIVRYSQDQKKPDNLLLPIQFTISEIGKEKYGVSVKSIFSFPK